MSELKKESGIFCRASRFQISALLVLLTTGLLAGCESVNDWMTAERVDYRSAHAGPALEVPIDLAPVPQNQHFLLPDSSKNVSNALPSYGASGELASKQDVYLLPSKRNAEQSSVVMHVEREEKVSEGQSRYWLVMPNAQLDTIWPQLRTFWEKNGFTLKEDQPALGWLETDWAENRAQIPNDWFRRAAGKWVDVLYSSGTLDKFRMVVEPVPPSGVRLMILHYGMEEVLVGRGKDSSIWQERPRNPELEKALLGRLMQSLGVSEKAVKTYIAQAKTVDARYFDSKRKLEEHKTGH